MERFPTALARAVAAEGVAQVFGLMGTSTVDLTLSLVGDHGVRYYPTRHEAAAVGAADGFARTGAGVGVAIISAGPGVTNAMTALTTARRGGSPLVLIAADSETASPKRYPFAGGTQALDEGLIFAALGVDVVRCYPRSVYEDVASAFARARERQVPVVLLYPLEANEASTATSAPAPVPGARPLAEPAPGELERAAQIVDDAERPLILAGLGAVRAGAGESLVRLADRCGALLATSLRGVGVFAGHRYDLGIFGGFSNDASAQLIAQSDCILAFGASLNGDTTQDGELVRSARIIQCDTHAAALDRFERAEHAILGDARAVADGLLELVEARAHSAGRAAADAAGPLGASSYLRPFDDISRPGQLDPRAVCRRVDALLPQARTVITDCGRAMDFPVEQMRVFAPDSLLWIFDFGAIGTGLAAALGAAVARPDRTPVLFIGDGALLMTLGELDTFVRERIPLLVVCLNDRGYGAEVLHMQMTGVPADLARFATPDLADVARSIGWRAETVHELADVDRLIPQVVPLQGPTLLNCLISEDPIPV